MKKRIISLLLCFSMLFGFAVPTMTTQADAFIGSLITTGLKMSGCIISNCVKVCKDTSKYDNAGQAVATLFKGAAEDFIGTKFGGGSTTAPDPSTGVGTTTIIQKVDLSQVESSLSAINTTLEKNTAAIYQLESTVTGGIESLSKKLDELSNQIKDSTKRLEYNNYLNSFFDFFNQYYEALSYYDSLVTPMLSDGSSQEYQKNVFDRFYQLQDVEYTGNFHSAVDKLGRYIQGTYLSANLGSVVDVLSQYYMLAYQDNDMSAEDAKVQAAKDTEDMIGYIYYAYTMGTYYEQAIALYQTAVITETGSAYRTDFNIVLTQSQIDTTIEKLWTTAQTTVGCMLKDLHENYPNSEGLKAVYRLYAGEVLSRTVAPGGSFQIEPDATVTLQDQIGLLSPYFSDEFCDAFTGLVPYQVDPENGYLTMLSGTMLKAPSYKSSAPNSVPVTVKAKLGSTTVYSFGVTYYPHSCNERFYAGAGTEDFPYLIKDMVLKKGSTQLQHFLESTAYTNAHVVLLSDIDMKDATVNTNSYYTGTFDGNGHTISNIKFRRLDSVHGAAMFGRLRGTVRNLVIQNATSQYSLSPNDSTKAESNYAAILACTLSGTIENCKVVNSTVDLSVTKSGAYETDHHALIAGGVVARVYPEGRLDTVVCENTTVTVSNPSTLGGGSTPYSSGWATAGGVAGTVDAGGKLFRFSYMQSKDSENKIFAYGGTGINVGGLIGWSDTESNNLLYSFVLLNTAPDCSGELTTSGHCYSSRFIGNHTANDFPGCCYYGWSELYHYKDSTDLDAFTMEAILAYYKDRNMGYFADPDIDVEADLSVFTDYGNNHIALDHGTKYTSFKKTEYMAGEYLDLSGYHAYQTVGQKVLDTETQGVSVYLDGSAAKVIQPLSEGEHTVRIVARGFIEAFTIHVSPLVHTYVTKTLTRATCTESGTTQDTCLLCGLQSEPVTVEPLGHIEVVTPAKEATCLEPGWTEGITCKRCGETLKESVQDPGTDAHQHVTVVGYPATCTKDGLTDGDVCALCGKVFAAQAVIPSAGHQTETVTVLEPSCVSGGVKQEKCSICGEIVKLENLDALGHDYQSTVTEPTCEKIGYTTHTCTHCGDSYTDSYTPLTGHHYGDGVVTQEPTCTEEGEMTYTCTCGKTHTEPIPTIAHDYAETVTDPTCTEMGYTTHSCTKCGDSYVDTYTSPRGHSWDESETVTAPTLIATGLLRQTCTVCDAHQDTVIPSLTSCDGGIDCASRKFTDVAGIHDWSHVGIDYAIRCSLFYGTSDTTFSPNAPMTRAMLVAVLYRMEGRPSIEGQSHAFQDVPNHAWYEDALIWASSNSVVSGVSETEFDPESNVTRQQVAAILHRYANLHSYDTSASTELSVYPDYEAVAPYAKSAMSWANATGLIQGSIEDGETLLCPDNSATRAQLAAILMRFMKNVMN